MASGFARFLRTAFPNGPAEYGHHRHGRRVGVNGAQESAEGGAVDKEIDAPIAAEPGRKCEGVIEGADAIQALAAWEEQRNHIIKKKLSMGLRP